MTSEPRLKQKRLAREHNTMMKMIQLYCHARHSPPANELCEDCMALKNYAAERIKHCPFQHNKPTCANCPIHCYQPAMREQIQQVMRWSGPRMVFHHPYLAFLHLLDRLRRPPNRPCQ